MSLKKASRLAVFAGALALSFNAAAAPLGAAPKPPAAETLSFYNTHTNERLNVVHRPGQAVSAETNWMMRDFRRRETATMDPKLFDLLYRLQIAIKARHPDLAVEFHIISAYRSPETNRNLRNAGGSQATKSLHMVGQAMDIRVPGLKVSELRDIATCLQAGGVGYYGGTDNFVHVDTGAVRYWPSRAYLSGLRCG